MRTKTLLLGAVLGAATVLPSMAQSTVYSVNAVGYVNKDLVAGFTMISNPLNTGANNLNSILPAVEDGTELYKFNNATQTFDQSSAFIIDTWIPDLTLAPGEGAFIRPPSAATVTFVGEVPQGTLNNPVPANFSIEASQVPQEGTLSQLGFPAEDGDEVYVFNPATQGYESAAFIIDAWSPNLTIKVAESFFAKKTTAATWTRVFNITN